MNTNTKKITVLLTMAIMLAACTTFVRTSYQTLSSVATIVDTARGGYNEFYKAGQITPELATKVEKAYPVYQAAMQVAISGVRAYQNLAATGIIVSPDSANKAIQDAQDATNALLATFAEAGLPKTDPLVIEKIVAKK